MVMHNDDMMLRSWQVWQELADQAPANRPLRRRAGLLIGQWVGKLKQEDRPMAYRALLSLLADPDAAMQLAGVVSLHALIDDWWVCALQSLTQHSWRLLGIR